MKPKTITREFNALFIGLGRGELLPFASKSRVSQSWLEILIASSFEMNCWKLLALVPQLISG